MFELGLLAVGVIAGIVVMRFIIGTLDLFG